MVLQKYLLGIYQMSNYKEPQKNITLKLIFELNNYLQSQYVLSKILEFQSLIVLVFGQATITKIELSTPLKLPVKQKK